MSQPSTIRRIWLTIAPCATPGRIGLRLSPVPPADMADCMAVLMTRGDVPQGWPLELDVVSDPTADPALRGLPGKDGVDGASAYQLARQQGYGGTLTQWLTTLVGAAGASAYDLARAAGYGGTQTAWLASLKGAAGKDASAYLGTITIGQTATVVIQAGIRRLVVAIPAALGVSAGDSLYLAPTKAIDGYALHDVVVISPTALSVGLTAPLLAIGASFAIPAKLFRFNT
jgi:hypothetical protein